MSPDDPRLFNNPVTEQDGYMEFCIPLRIHGDGVPFGKASGHSLDTWSISSLVGELGDSWNTRTLLFGIANICKLTLQHNGIDTMAQIMLWLIWSLKQLVTGVYNPNGPNGEPLEGDRWQRQVAGQRICGRYVLVSSRLLGIWTGCVTICMCLGISMMRNRRASSVVPTERIALGRTCVLERPGWRL